MCRWLTCRRAFQEASYYLLTVTDSQATPLPLATQVPFASSVLFQQTSIFLNHLTLCLHTNCLLFLVATPSTLVSPPYPTQEEIRLIPQASLTLIPFWGEISLCQSHCRKHNTRKSWLYFSMMTEHFGAEISNQF